MKQKLTKWFPADVKPVNIGLYETDAVKGNSFQFWTGKYWGLQGSHSNCFPNLSDNAKDISIYQNVKWRGLAEKPN